MGAQFYYRQPFAPSPTSPPAIGIVALIENDGCLLLERRSDCGRWSIIGGSMEDNEAFDGTIRREVFEETGLTVRGYTFFHRHL